MCRFGTANSVWCIKIHHIRWRIHWRKVIFMKLHNSLHTSHTIWIVCIQRFSEFPLLIEGSWLVWSVAHSSNPPESALEVPLPGESQSIYLKTTPAFVSPVSYLAKLWALGITRGYLPLVRVRARARAEGAAPSSPFSKKFSSQQNDPSHFYWAHKVFQRSDANEDLCPRQQYHRPW